MTTEIEKAIEILENELKGLRNKESLTEVDRQRATALAIQIDKMHGRSYRILTTLALALGLR